MVRPRQPIRRCANWRDERFGGNEGMAPGRYDGPNYPAGERAAFTPVSRSDADAAASSQAQGHAGSGMRTDPMQSSTPSSATDASVASSDYSQGQRARRDLDGRDLMNQTVDPRSVPQLLSDVARELTTLFRKEGQLIRAELSEKATQLQVGAGSVLAGAICLLAALMVLLQAVVIGLTNAGLNPGWASLIVGVVVALVGIVLLKKGTSDMSNLTPERTAHQVAKDANLVKEQVR